MLYKPSASFVRSYKTSLVTQWKRSGEKKKEPADCTVKSGHIVRTALWGTHCTSGSNTQRNKFSYNMSFIDWANNAHFSGDLEICCWRLNTRFMINKEGRTVLAQQEGYFVQTSQSAHFKNLLHRLDLQITCSIQFFLPLWFPFPCWDA